MNIPFLFEGIAILLICLAVLFVVKDAQYYQRKFKRIEMKLAKLASTNFHLSRSSSSTRLIEW